MLEPREYTRFFKGGTIFALYVKREAQVLACGGRQQVQQLSTPPWGRAHRIERKKKNGDEQEGRTDIHLARRLDVKTSVLSPY
ncbi:hypothetical protein ANTRET_LOCUS3299 [Anthophora retusa]